MFVLARGIPAWSRTLGRWAYCIACVDKDGKWYRLYPVPLENGRKNIAPFDVIKPFVIKRCENGRPESCRIDPWLIWKAGVVQESDRSRILQQITESGSFMHDDSWRRKTLALVAPSLLKISIAQKATISYYCSYPECDGHTGTFFDVFQIDKRKRKLILPAQDLLRRLSGVKEENLRFVVGTMRKHPQRWIVVETLICVKGTVSPLNSWITAVNSGGTSNFVN